jgi:alpha-beta hydrolase superfamily lysophospholipase
MTAFNPDTVRQALLRLDLAVFAPLRPPVSDYCHFYGIDFEQEIPGLRHYCGWFDAAGYRLAAHVFLPPSAQGTVFILHGYLDHSGLYAKLIRHCLKAGYAVFIHDLPGHGLSTGERAGIPDFQDYQRVLNEALALYGQQLPRPFYAIGQSTGGAILMDHVLTARAQGRQPAFRKMLLLAPLVRPAQWAQIRFGYWAMRLLKPSLPRVFRLNSSDAEFLRFVREDDPLQERWVPLQWVGALKRWVAYMQKLPACDFPVLLVQGHRDETVAWRYNIGFVKRHFSVEQFLELPEASHQLANERDDLRAPVHKALDLMLGVKI